MNGFSAGRLMEDRASSSFGMSNSDLDRESFTSSICEITDNEGRSDNPLHQTTNVLRVCRKEVLGPYWKLLLMIGWRRFGRDRINYHCGWRLLNLVYPVLLVLLMFYFYTYRTLSCHNKYDIPLIAIPTVKPVTTAPDATVSSLLPLNPSINNYQTCTHLISSYILPDLLHFSAYLLGFWYFRVQDNEQMDALIQQAFLHATPIQHGSNTQSMMIRTMKWILVGGATWVVAMVGLFVLYLVAFGFENTIYPFFPGQHTWNVVLLCVHAFGCLIYNSIIAAVVVNYAVQCETIICFVRSIQENLLEKAGDLRMVMHDILKVWQATRQLNGPMAKMMSLCVFNFAEMVVIGLSLLLFRQNNNSVNASWVMAYRICFLVVWFLILIFPLVQASRLSSSYDKFAQAALEMRVFGYLTSTPRELDSFLKFVTTAKCKVCLLFIPVDKSSVFGTLLLASFLVIILIQTGILSAPSPLL